MKILREVVFATKINVLVHFMRGLLEPAIWQLLQWIWSLEASDIDEFSATQRLQFYRYSATSVLLFIFESIPHTVILGLLAIGSLTVFGLILAVLFCSCRITYYAVFRLIVKFIAWNLIKSLFACTRLTVLVLYRFVLYIYITISRFFRSPRNLLNQNALEHSAPLAITSDNLTNMHSRTSLTYLLSQPITSHLSQLKHFDQDDADHDGSELRIVHIVLKQRNSPHCVLNRNNRRPAILTIRNNYSLRRKMVPFECALTIMN